MLRASAWLDVDPTVKRVFKPPLLFFSLMITAKVLSKPDREAINEAIRAFSRGFAYLIYGSRGQLQKVSIKGVLAMYRKVAKVDLVLSPALTSVVWELFMNVFDDYIVQDISKIKRGEKKVSAYLIDVRKLREMARELGPEGFADRVARCMGEVLRGNECSL